MNNWQDYIEKITTAVIVAAVAFGLLLVFKPSRRDVPEESENKPTTVEIVVDEPSGPLEPIPESPPIPKATPTDDKKIQSDTIEQQRITLDEYDDVPWESPQGHVFIAPKDIWQDGRVHIQTACDDNGCYASQHAPIGAIGIGTDGVYYWKHPDGKFRPHRNRVNKTRE